MGVTGHVVPIFCLKKHHLCLDPPNPVTNYQWVCEKDKHPSFENHAKTLADFVTNNKDRFKGEHVFKLWPSKFDQDEFRRNMPTF